MKLYRHIKTGYIYEELACTDIVDLGVQVVVLHRLTTGMIVVRTIEDLKEFFEVAG